MKQTGLKIAFVSGCLKLGGSTTLLFNLANGLQNHGVEVKIYSLEKENPLAALFREFHIDVTCQDESKHIFEDRLSGVYSSLAAFAPDVVVATLSASSFEILRYVPPGVTRVGLILADAAPVYKMVSNYAQHMDILAGNSKGILEKTRSMPCFNNLSQQWFVTGASPSPFASPDFSTSLRIIFLSRMIREQKRVHFLPEIIRQLSDSQRPFHFTMAGGGPDLDWLKENIPALREGQIIEFTGQIAFEKVDESLRGNHIFLLTSDYEGQPLALVHAMMNGVVPVVSALESGIPELVNSITGVLVDPNNISAYAEAILNLDSSRDRLAKLSIEARNHVESHFSAQAMAKQWLDFLDGPPRNSIAWQRSIRIRAPIIDSRKWYYKQPVRFIRKIARKLTSQ